MTDLANINAELAAMEPGKTRPEDAILLLGKLELLAKQVREMREHAEAAIVELLDGSSVQVGSVWYYAGPDRITRCRDPLPAVEALLSACGGDLARFVDCLASNALKYGACRKVFEEAGSPEWWDAHFEVVERVVLKEGKAQPKLQKYDAKYLR